MAAYRIIEIESWAQFQAVVAGPELVGWAFRGQENSTWALESTIGRILRTFNVHPSVWSQQEERVNRVFRRKAHLFLDHIPADEDDFQWLALMQHHGAPTRLLDFTWSPYVALFFALERASTSAAVWAICAPRVWQQKHKIPGIRNRVNTSDLYLREPGNYRKWYLNGTVPFVVQGEPFVMNQRLIAQSGTFVVPGVIDRSVDVILTSYSHTDKLMVKLVIDAKKLRDEFMLHLYTMNITNASLFPGMDGLARSLNYELEYHWQYNPKTLDVHPSFQ